MSFTLNGHPLCEVDNQTAHLMNKPKMYTMWITFREMDTNFYI